MNIAVVVGRLTRDIELRYLQGGQAIATGTIAVNRVMSAEAKTKAESAGKPTADFINIVAWGKTAEYLANYTEKGGRVGVEGRIQTGSYKAEDGTMRYTTDIVCNRVEVIDYKETNSQEPSSQGRNDFSGIEGFDDVDPSQIPF